MITGDQCFCWLSEKHHLYFFCVVRERQPAGSVWCSARKICHSKLRQRQCCCFFRGKVKGMNNFASCIASHGIECHHANLILITLTYSKQKQRDVLSERRRVNQSLLGIGAVHPSCGEAIQAAWLLRPVRQNLA